MDHQNQTKRFPALNFEYQRHFLAINNQWKKFEKTYNQSVTLPDSNTPNFWDKHFDLKPTLNPMEIWRAELILKLIQPFLIAQDPIANIGIGSGLLEQHIHETIPLKKNYTGLDMTDKTLENLKSKLSGISLKKYNDIANLTLADQSQSVVLLLEVLEHIKPQQTFDVLKEVKRVLQANGTFIISVPLNEGLAKMLPTNPNSHLRLYSIPVLLAELQLAGFKVLKYDTASAFGSGFWWKHAINQYIPFKLANNVVVVCQKK